MDDEIVELSLPEWMACPLINDDWTGIEDEEDQKKMDELVEYLQSECLWVTGCSEESYFLNHPSLDAQVAYGETLGGMYLTYYCQCRKLND